MFCAYTRPRYQVNVYRTIGPLVCLSFSKCFRWFIKDRSNAIHMLPFSLLHIIGMGFSQCCRNHAPRLKLFFMLNSADHEILTANQFQNSLNKWIFQA